MLSVSSLSIANTKIGVLDINKVLATIPQIKNMQANLKKKFDPRGKQVINLQNSFRNDITNYRKTNGKGKEVHKRLKEKNVICDWREPDVIRLAPVPLYNTFQDVHNFVQILSELISARDRRPT